MKLRYYLRGLGIGILVTAFIIGIVRSPQGDMSDAEIRARAAELGMVDANSQVLSNLSQEKTDDDGGASPETEGAQSEEKPDGTEPGNGADPSQTEPDAPGNEPEQGSGAGRGNLAFQDGDADAPGNEDPQDGSGNLPEEPSEASGHSQEPDEPPVETVRFTIRGGTGSEGICRDLAAAGLVESASDYDAFLCDNGYSQRLRSGTFEIPVGAGYEEIARMITGG